MKITRRFVFALALLAGSAFATTAMADQVDDLLAGKPVVISAKTGEQDTEASAAPASEGDRVLERILSGPTHEAASLSHKSYEVQLSEPSLAGLETDEHEVAAGDSAAEIEVPETPANMSLVPEPSAVALAALSLVYFVIFFRRRYAF